MKISDISGTLTWSYFTSLTLLSPILDLTTQLNQVTNKRKPAIREGKNKLDLAFNNVKPKDWYFVLD